MIFARIRTKRSGSYIAVIAASNIQAITRQVLGYKGDQLNYGNQWVEVFRIAAGQLGGDTAVLTPSNGNVVTSVQNAGHNLTTTPTSNVTITLLGGTVALPAIDVWLIGPQNMRN